MIRTSLRAGSVCEAVIPGQVSGRLFRPARHRRAVANERWLASMGGAVGTEGAYSILPTFDFPFGEPVSL